MTTVYLVISWMMRSDNIVLATYTAKELAEAHLNELEKTFVQEEVRDGDRFFIQPYLIKDPSVLSVSASYVEGEHGWSQ